MKFKDALNLSVGMSTGQVRKNDLCMIYLRFFLKILLFDLRSNKPYFVKDHNYNLPIKRIDFHTQNDDYILSIDKKICKIWNRHTVRNTFHNR
jgi:ribosome biogenesis protein ENP2